MGVGLSQRRQSGGALSLTRMLHSHYQSVLQLNGKAPRTKYITPLKTFTLDQIKATQKTFLRQCWAESCCWWKCMRFRKGGKIQNFILCNVRRILCETTLTGRRSILLLRVRLDLARNDIERAAVACWGHWPVASSCDKKIMNLQTSLNPGNSEITINNMT